LDGRPLGWGLAASFLRKTGGFFISGIAVRRGRIVRSANGSNQFTRVQLVDLQIIPPMAHPAVVSE
jgi:hypothetical protein